MKKFNEFITEVENLEEKNKPTQPEKWARAKAAAKSKFAVYPSAYANAWASKKYKAMGGSWRSTKEEVEELDELNYDTVKSLYQKRRADFHGAQVGKKKKGKDISAKNVSTSISRLMGHKPTQNQPVKEEVELDEAKRYPYKFRATYHDPDTNKVTNYYDFTHRNLDAAKKHAQNSRVERKDGKQDKLHSVVQMEEYDVEELFDILEEVVNGIAEESNIDPEILWENLEDVSDEELYETAAWRRKEGKNPTGGLNRKGIMSYRRENPGSKLSMAVTGKVKPGSKAAKRRKSFCARMGGMPGPMKKPNGKPTRKALALRKWKCR
jgi:Domain of unknown function (DUF6321)